MLENQPHITFLFGAGASIPAGLSGIAELTRTFELEKIEGKHKEAYYFIKNVLKKTNKEAVDIENILQQLNEFVYGSIETSRLFYKEQDPGVNEHKEKFPDLIKAIKKHLREKLELEYKTEYLLGLKGITESFGSVEIFSLNYDSVIETFCELQGITYTDGFKLYWNPNEFDENYTLKLYKLHGSLYWFKTESGKLIKIPAKGLENDLIKFYSDETISESIVYPTIVKELELNPYSFLRNQLMATLSKTDLMIVVGYSFRDALWLNIIKEQLNTNQNLWVLIVDLCPEQIRKKIVEGNNDIHDRVMTLTKNSEDAFGLRIINNRINQIKNIKENEKHYLHQISNNSNLPLKEFFGLIQKYKEINHLSRVKTITEQTFRTRFTNKLAVLPQLTNELFICSLEFGIDCCIKRDWKLAETWFQILAFKTLATENKIVNEYNYWMPETREKWIKSFETEMGTQHFAMGTPANKEDMKKLLDFELADKLEKLDPQTKNNIQGIIARIETMNINVDQNSIMRDSKKFYDELTNISVIFPLAQLLRSFSVKIPQNENLTTNWQLSIQIQR